MATNILNKNISQYDDGYVQYATPKQHLRLNS